ncbi:hypothetical protein CEXT_777771 [Caerostris extrusa]|uniref:Uncharacterized protein n=1 Tax=Caerostris extrusa TaxID=172846 RepID=A0AAV4XUB7_CAEEX|nr:hypothetical protein CEXT_777771 [Caerostris extrusa]
METEFIEACFTYSAFAVIHRLGTDFPADVFDGVAGFESPGKIIRTLYGGRLASGYEQGFRRFDSTNRLGISGSQGPEVVVLRILQW